LTRCPHILSVSRNHADPSMAKRLTSPLCRTQGGCYTALAGRKILALRILVLDTPGETLFKLDLAKGIGDKGVGEDGRMPALFAWGFCDPRDSGGLMHPCRTDRRP